jgi:hypothetical protein
MIIFYKNKGILIIVYPFVCLFGTGIIVEVLRTYVGGMFAKIDFHAAVGFGFLLAAIWTYFTKDDYYKDREGNKKKMDTENSFFFMNMAIWAYIFFGLSLLFLASSFDD